MQALCMIMPHIVANVAASLASKKHFKYVFDDVLYLLLSFKSFEQH